MQSASRRNEAAASATRDKELQSATSGPDERVLESVCRRMIRHLPASYCLRRIGGSVTVSTATATTSANTSKPGMNKYADESFHIMKTPLSILTDAVRFHARFLETSVNIVGADILLGMTEVYAANRKGLFAGGRSSGGGQVGSGRIESGSGSGGGAHQKMNPSASGGGSVSGGVNYVIAGDKIRVQVS